MMLRHFGLNDHANRISTAVFSTIQNGQTRTRDMGGQQSTTEFTNTIIAAL
jgi:isocitrate dehydrogenase (NAD+)